LPEPIQVTEFVDVSFQHLALSSINQHFPFIQVIPLAESEPEVGSLVNVQGWGSSGNLFGETNLQYASDLPVVQDEEVQSSVGSNANWDQLFCTNTREGGVCAGDFGAPVTSIEEGELVQVGMVSVVTPAVCRDAPSCFISVDVVNDWLK